MTFVIPSRGAHLSRLRATRSSVGIMSEHLIGFEQVTVTLFGFLLYLRFLRITVALKVLKPFDFDGANELVVRAARKQCT